MTFIPDPSWPSIIDLAREVWGEPTDETKKDEIRFGTNQGQKVTPSKNTWKDFDSGEGGGYIDLWKKARKGAPLPPRTDDLGKKTNGNGKRTGPKPWDDIGETYDYPGTNADPRLVQVVRTNSGKPRFRQRQPLGNDRWKWNVQDIPDHDRRLYKLAEVRAAPMEEIIWICAGDPRPQLRCAAGQRRDRQEARGHRGTLAARDRGIGQGAAAAEPAAEGRRV
jgi:hypothetical protein